MSYREVTALRRAGRLDEARAMAAYDLEKEYSDWTLDAMFWVERDLCLRHLDKGESAKAKERFNYMKHLLEYMNDNKGYAARALGFIRSRMDPYHDKVEELTSKSKNGQEEEAYREMEQLFHGTPLPASFHESYGWIIYRYLKKCQQSLSTAEIDTILLTYLSLGITRPSNLHSLMLGQSGKVSERHPDFNLLCFVEQWGVENFLEEDFESSEWNGKTVEPRVSRLIQYCFKRGCSIGDVCRVFTTNERISQEEIYETFCRQQFFTLNNLQQSNDTAFLHSARTYFDSVEGVAIKNHYHSIILSLYLNKLSENRIEEIPSVIEKWGWDSIRPEDWERQKGTDGTEFSSLVEKIVRGYLSYVKHRGYKGVGEDFERLLRQAIERYDNDEHERALAQILLARGEREAALAIYRRLLLTMNKYYVWKELSEITDDKELKLSALCKAVLAEKNDDYLGDVHLSLARLMEESGHPYEARCELELYASTYNKNKWRAKPEYSDLFARLQPMTKTGTIPKNNKSFYFSHTETADAFVYADITWKTMVLTDIFTVERFGKKKKRGRLTGKKGKSLVVNLRLLPDHATLGQSYDIKTYRKGGREVVVLSRKSDKKAEEIIKRKGCSST